MALVSSRWRPAFVVPRGREALRGAFRLTRSQTGRTFAVNAFNLGVGLVTSVLLARWLGPTGRGELAAALLWPTLLGYLFGFGLNPAVMYRIAGTGSPPGPVLGTALVMGLLQGLGGAAIGYALLPLLLHSQSDAVVAAGRIFMLAVPVMILTQCLLAVLWAHMRMRVFNTLRMLVPVGYLAGSSILLLAGALTLWNILLLQLVLNALTLAAAAVATWATGLARSLRVERAHARELLSYGVRVHAGTLSQMANTRLDQVLLTAFFAPTPVGLYVAAQSTATVPAALTNAVQLVSTPRIASAENGEARARALEAVFARYWRLVVAATLVLLVAVPFLLPILYGRAFTAAVVPALVLLLGTLVMGAKDVLGSGSQALGTPWLASRAEIVGTAVSIGMLLVLLPLLGILGAALTVLVSAAIQLILVARGLRRLHGVATVPTFTFASRAAIEQGRRVGRDSAELARGTGPGDGGERGHEGGNGGNSGDGSSGSDGSKGNDGGTGGGRGGTWALVLVSTAVALAGAEVSLRLLAPRPDPYAPLKSIGSAYVPSAFQPFDTLHFRIEPGLPGMDSTARFTTNNLGFRGDPLVRPKPAGEARVFLIGGSTLETLYLDDSLSVSHVLQRRLSAGTQPDVPAVRVYNAAKSGDKSFDHVAMLAHRLVHLEPDAVVVMLGVNDLIAAASGRDYLLMGETTPGSAGRWLRLLATESQLARHLHAALTRLDVDTRLQAIRMTTDYAAKAELRRQGPSAAGPPRLDLDSFRENVLSLVGLARSHGFALVLVTHPSSWAGPDSLQAERWHWMRLIDGRVYDAAELDGALESYNDILRQTAASAELPLVDLARYLPKNFEYFYDDVHFTVRGADSAAALLSGPIAGALERRRNRASAAGEPAPQRSPNVITSRPRL